MAVAVCRLVDVVVLLGFVWEKRLTVGRLKSSRYYLSISRELEHTLRKTHPLTFGGKTIFGRIFVWLAA